MKTLHDPKAARSPFRNFIVLLFMVLACTSSFVWSQEFDQDTQGRIEFDSYTPKSLFDVARERRANWQAQRVWGMLTLPKDHKVKVPAMVLLHGSGGIEASMKQWVDAFDEIGIATFVVAVSESRGVKRTAENQSLVPAASDISDAFQSLQLLAKHPAIDPSRIGVMGFSRGGSTVFQAALEPFRRALVKSDLRFALHIAAYAGCNQVYWSPDLTKAPLLNMLGEADDYTTPGPCIALAEKYKQAGTPVKTVVFPGANHSWDGMYRVVRMPLATSAAPCGVIRWDMDTWKITAEKTGEQIPVAQFGDYMKSCTTRGGQHAGRDENAFRESRRLSQEFAKAIFFGR